MRFFAATVAILALASALTLHRLGAADVCGVNEAVEGVFLQQMVEHGAMLFPLENGRAPMYKPPLFHWTATAIDRAVGIKKVTAANLRLTAALYAIAGVALTMGFAATFLGPGGTILAGLILCGSYQYIEQGRIGRVDMTLTFFETAALFTFMWWLAPRRSAASTPENPPAESIRGHGILRYIFALALGLGVLAKGPVGAFLPAAACGLFMVMERRLGDLRKIAAPGPVMIGVIVGGSWYAACIFARRYGFLDRQIGSENFGRFFRALGAMAPWYYVKPILLNSAPLSLMVPVAVWYAIRTYRSSTNEHASSGSQPDVGDDDRARSAVRLFAIFWIITVVFFTIAAYKRRAYLLPLWPASAVMIAWWIEGLARTSNIGRYLRAGVATTCLGLAVFNFVYLPQREVRECRGDSFKATATQINRIVGPDEPLYSFGLGDEPAPFLFYLDRDAPPIEGKLGDAPPGYVIVPADVWAKHQNEALDLEPIFESSSGGQRLVLLRHGKAYALRWRRWNYGCRCAG